MSNEQQQLLVSIGVPLRNPGDLLPGMMDQLLKQTYGNIEIVISDNNSSDDTQSLCEEYARRDPRIKYHRQSETISAIENFRFVQDHSSGVYFMWAAHDDRRDMNFVEELVKALEANKRAVLAFPSAYDFEDYNNMKEKLHGYSFTTDENTPFMLKLSRLLKRSTHAYGLYRRHVFQNWYWYNIDYGWDQVFLGYVGQRGDFVKTDKTNFYCYYPTDRSGKTPEARALIVSYKKLRPFPGARRAWGIASAACYGDRVEGRYRSAVLSFLGLYIPYVWWPWFKQEVRKISPQWFIDLYLQWKSKQQTAV